MNKIAKRVLKWIEDHPLLQLGVILFLVIQAVWTFVGDRIVAPKRAAILGGYSHDPELWLQFDGTKCEAINMGSHPLIQVQLVGISAETRIDGRNCEPLSYRETPPVAYAEKLAHRGRLTINDIYRFGFMYFADAPAPPVVVSSIDATPSPLELQRSAGIEEAKMKDCRRQGNCIGFAGCRATFRREADHKQYRTLDYVVIDPLRDSKVPVPLANYYSERLLNGKRGWGIQKAFSCVSQAAPIHDLVKKYMWKSQTRVEPVPE